MTLRSNGFTLIELMIALAIFAFLMMLAGPMYSKFMADHQIRNATDSMLNGVQQAQAAAVRNNAFARLSVDTTTGTGGWQVLQTIDGTESATPVQVYTVKDGAPLVKIDPKPQDVPKANAQVTFDGFGRIVPNVDASATLTCLKVTNTNGTRPLNVVVSSNGLAGTKLCDPAAAAGEPQACPAGCN